MKTSFFSHTFTGTSFSCKFWLYNVRRFKFRKYLPFIMEMYEFIYRIEAFLVFFPKRFDINLKIYKTFLVKTGSTFFFICKVVPIRCRRNLIKVWLPAYFWDILEKVPWMWHRVCNKTSERLHPPSAMGLTVMISLAFPRPAAVTATTQMLYCLFRLRLGMR